MHDPEGVVQPGHAFFFEKRDENRAHGDVDAGRGQPDGDGNEQRQGAPQGRIPKIDNKAETEAFPAESGNLDEKLHEPPGDDTEGHAGDRIAAAADKPAVKSDRHSDGRQIEKSRCQGGQEKGPLRVEVAHGPGGQSDKKEKGKDDGRQPGRQLDLFGNAAEADGDQTGQLGREKYAGDRNQTGSEKQDIENIGSKTVLRLLPLRLFGSQDRDKGRGQGGLGEQIAQKVGDAEGGHEGVRRPSGSEKPGEYGFADEPQNAAYGRADAERTDAPGDVFHGFFRRPIIDRLRPDAQPAAVFVQLPRGASIRSCRFFSS